MSTIKNSRILPVIIDTFIGNKVAKNLSTEMSTRLNTDTENERYHRYVETLQMIGVKTFLKTASPLIEYTTHKLSNKNEIRESHISDVVVGAASEILCSEKNFYLQDICDNR